MLKSVLAFVVATMIFAVLLAWALFYLVKILAFEDQAGNAQRLGVVPTVALVFLSSTSPIISTHPR
jgi:flagellar biogenesis protein FliO